MKHIRLTLKDCRAEGGRRRAKTAGTKKKKTKEKGERFMTLQLKSRETKKTKKSEITFNGNKEEITIYRAPLHLLTEQSINKLYEIQD